MREEHSIQHTQFHPKNFFDRPIFKYILRAIKNDANNPLGIGFSLLLISGIIIIFYLLSTRHPIYDQELARGGYYYLPLSSLYLILIFGLTIKPSRYTKNLSLNYILAAVLSMAAISNFNNVTYARRVILGGHLSGSVEMNKKIEAYLNSSEETEVPSEITEPARGFAESYKKLVGSCL